MNLWGHHKFFLDLTQLFLRISWPSASLVTCLAEEPSPLQTDTTTTPIVQTRKLRPWAGAEDFPEPLGSAYWSRHGLCSAAPASLCCAVAASIPITHPGAPRGLLTSAVCYQLNRLISPQNHVSSGQGNIFPRMTEKKAKSPTGGIYRKLESPE